MQIPSARHARAARLPTPSFPRWLTAALLGVALGGPVDAGATSGGDSLVVAARDAHRKRESARLATLREQLDARAHPLAGWADYWDLELRLARATPAEVEAFYARWPGTYVEDRLRNDWLLELGKRRDWSAFRRDHARLRLDDDREVACYAVLAGDQQQPAVREQALAAWLAQRDADDGCQHMARRLLSSGVFSARDVWHKVRLATEQARSATARAALGLLGAVPGAAMTWWTQPARTLDRGPAGRPADELDALALARLAASDPYAAARRLDAGLAEALPADWVAWIWAQVGRHAAVRLQPYAVGYFRRAESAALRTPGGAEWSDETLAWQVRAALRSEPTDWRMVCAAVDAMSETAQRETVWVYWGARAAHELAPPGPDGEPQRAAAERALGAIAGRMDFYGKLAAEELGQALQLPARPAALTAEEREYVHGHAGLARALRLMDIGLRSEGVREWNWSVRGMDDRQLLAAAQLACERGAWDRCIHTSERTRHEVDVAQRYPMPYRDAVLGQADRAGVDPALVYGLIRQESRFVADARSHVGATGLMQVMPATARWTARRLGMPYSRASLRDRDVNLRLGTAYLRLLLDDFEGSQALATAAYNAGPGRPRRWRDGPELDPAMWAETIPFGETRDYVKKVLSNAVYYAAILHEQEAPPLRVRLGERIGPRLASAPPPDLNLP